MKKILALILALAMIACVFAACGDETPAAETEAPVVTDGAPDASGDAPVVETNSDLKVGVVLIGDENEGYTYAHIVGVRAAVATLGLDEASNIIWKYTIGENEACYDAIVDCIDQGASLVITNSYGHQSFAQQVAEEYPDVQIVSMTGDTARASGLANFHNAFTRIYEARYIGGIVAGMKINELVAEGKLTDKNYDGENVKVGYVGAYPYAEVVSGYTAFYLGIKSVCENVVMDVQYTNSWFDITAENEAAKALIEKGCVIIGQHADSTGAPSACEEALNAGTIAYSVGYNVDMLAAAPNAALTSPTNEWGVYYTYIFGAMLNGEVFEQNWAEGFEQDAVAVTTLGPACAAGTQEAVDAAIASFKEGSLHVFDTKTFTVGGAEVTSAFATDTDGDFTPDADEAIIDGYFHESYFQSAPAFQLRIDGITELN